MHIYAMLNEDNICIGVSQLAGAKNEPNMVKIEAADIDLIGRKYENGKWSTEKYHGEQSGPTYDERLRAVEDALLQFMLGGIA